MRATIVIAFVGIGLLQGCAGCVRHPATGEEAPAPRMENPLPAEPPQRVERVFFSEYRQRVIDWVDRCVAELNRFDGGTWEEFLKEGKTIPFCLPILCQLVLTGDKWVYKNGRLEWVALLMGLFKDKQAVPALVHVLRDSYQEARFGAISALNEIGIPEVLREYWALALDDPYVNVRLNALVGIALYGDERDLEVVRKAKYDKHGSVQAKAEEVEARLMGK